MPFGLGKGMLNAEMRPLIFKGFAKARVRNRCWAPGTLPGSRQVPKAIDGGVPVFSVDVKGRQKCIETGKVESEMKNAADIKKGAVDLYWLAFLLTGRQDTSIDIAADAAASWDYANQFFEDWMRNWQRRLVMAKALGAIHEELADSARRTKIAHAGSSGTPRNWSLGPDTTKDDLERALLAIDLFPRAALLLLVFERLRIADAAILLDADQDLLKKAQVLGLRELTANLAARTGGGVTPTVAPAARHLKARMPSKRHLRAGDRCIFCRSNAAAEMFLNWYAH
jgi:DNA-directed RNA polymerase specialized sigma24 family protein